MTALPEEIKHLEVTDTGVRCPELVVEHCLQAIDTALVMLIWFTVQFKGIQLSHLSQLLLEIALLH